MTCLSSQRDNCVSLISLAYDELSLLLLVAQLLFK